MEYSGKICLTVEYRNTGIAAQKTYRYVYHAFLSPLQENEDASVSWITGKSNNQKMPPWVNLLVEQ